MAKIVSHTFDKGSASEIVVLEDSHGRQLHVRVAILRERCPHCGRAYDGAQHDADELIRQAREEFERDEQTIAQHLGARFDPQTLERLP